MPFNVKTAAVQAILVKPVDAQPDISQPVLSQPAPAAPDDTPSTSTGATVQAAAQPMTATPIKAEAAQSASLATSQPALVEDAAPALTPATPAPLPARDLAVAPTPVSTTSLSSLSNATIETTTRIAAQITRQLNGRATRFEMGLTPEGLGRVDVRLDIDADGQLTARLAFDNPLAATDLRGRADELRSQLQEAGFKVAPDSLTFSQRDASTDGGAAQQRQQDRAQSRAFLAANRIGADADAPPPAWTSLSLKTSSGVDMKV